MNQVKTNLACLASALLLAVSASAATNWANVTKRYVVNPCFDNNSEEGWTWESNASTQAVRVECISFYNGNFDLHQKLKKLPKGRYRLSVQGFYRTGENGSAYDAHKNGNENITSAIYAGSNQKKLVSLYSASMDNNAAGRCWTNDNVHWYPDGKEAAEEAFAAGKYWNELEFDAEGDVVIGVKCSEYDGNNYCVLDNFKLEYAGDGGKVWIDLTDQLLRNPGFSGNDQSGWTWESDASSQNADYDCMEFWNGWFNMWQTVKDLPKGKYRLSVQTYYRAGDNDWAYGNYKNGTEDITAVMFADDQKNHTQQKLKSVYSEWLTSDVGGCYWNDGKYFPNTMFSASKCFEKDMYWNTMEFEAEGDVNIGLQCYDHAYSNWCIFDNFTLEYYGELVDVSSIEVTAGHTELVVGETATLNAKVMPINATMAWVDWASDNVKVCTVDKDGNVTAVGEGTATITATASDGSGVTGSITITVVRNPATANSLVINEIMVSNVDEYLSGAFNFDGFVELYNPTDRAVELGGLKVSDTANGEGPWTMPADMGIVPAKGFRLVWFDSNNIDQKNATFKLDTDGGTISIADASGSEIAKQSYPAGVERASYARAQDGTGEWGLTATPTPGSTNNGIAHATQQIEAPVVDQPSQLATGALTVNVTIPAGCTLRYTTDGTLPTMTNGETSSTGRFSVKETTNLRFRLFADGKLPSRVTTRSYIIGQSGFYLPVVSVVTDPNFLYSQEYGVFEKGPNGRPGNGQSSNCNWNMDWERPVNFSYLDANGKMTLNQDVNLEMCGGWSRAWTPHSFKLKGSKELGGDKNLPYPFFSQKPYIRNRTLQIRNGGNDTGCRIKDAALQYILQSSGVNVDCQSYEPVHEFINGEYIGVLNVREPNNKHYVYANYGWDEDEIDQFEMSPDSGYVQKCGTPDAYLELVDVLSPDAANSETYSEICRRIDIDAYANYMAAQLYLANWDWPQNNVKGFRHREDGKFRFVFFDLDGVFNSGSPFQDFMNKEQYTFDQLYPTSLGRITDHIRFVTLFKNLIKNADFRRRFIDAYCIMGGSVFEKNRAKQIINELVNYVEPAMNLNWGSAWGTANDLIDKLNNRQSAATNALKNYSAFGMKNTNTQNVVLSSDTEGGVIFINDQKVPTGKFSGHLLAPVQLRAQAPAGYVFNGWLDNTGNVKYSEQEITMPTGKVELKASFRAMTDAEKKAHGIAPICINEVSAANDSYIDENGKKGDWVELYNTTDTEIDVEGMYLTDNLDKPEKYQITKGETQARTIIPAHGYLIIWCDKRATTDGGMHASFKISDDGGQLQLMAADKSWTNVITYAAHDSRSTVMRYPDGCADVYTTNVPTIAKSNAMTSYVTAVDQHSGSGMSPLIAGADGFRICYGSQQLVVKSEASATIDVAIYTADGRLVEETTVSIAGETGRLDVSTLASGFYVARAKDAAGRQVSCKFMK